MSSMNGNAKIQVQAVNPTRHDKSSSYSDELPPAFSERDDLDARDELRERELEEARARASQMEKTMRWWSDCTANWREKWGKVRAERNKAREENRQLKLKLEAAVKEISNLKRERLAAQELQSKLEKENERLEKELKKDKRSIPSARVEPSLKENSPDHCDGLKNASVYETTVPKLGAEKQFIEQILQKNEFYEGQCEDGNVFERSHSVPAEERKRSRVSSKKQKSIGVKHADEGSSQQVSLIRMKLEQTEKLLIEERSSKQNLREELDGLQSDLAALKLKNEELMVSHQDYAQEIVRVRSRHEKEVGQLNADLEEACNSTNNSANARKISELRGEIERLQAENTEEWSKCDKLESEKLALERENKKMRLQIEDLTSQLTESSKVSKGLLSADVKQLQTQLDEKNRELQELRHAYGKVRKQLQEKAEELSHTKKRVEQHENEVRKLRTRVEELKIDLTKAEDEVDCQTSNMKKLQRNLDEKTELADSYKVQLEHLNSRLKVGGIAPSINPRYIPGQRSSTQLSSDESEEEPSFH